MILKKKLIMQILPLKKEKKLLYDVKYTTGNGVHNCKIAVDRKYIANQDGWGHPFECIAKEDDYDLCFSEIIAINPMTTELVKLLSLPDEELKKHFFNNNVGSYRARLIKIYNYLWI